MELQIVTLPGRPVAQVRHVGPYAGAQGAWMTLMGWAMAQGLVTPETEYLGVSHDNPEVTPEAELRYDASITVPEGTLGADPVAVSVLPGGKFAMALHTGPYEKLSETYQAIMQAMAAQALVFRVGPCVEKYVNNPMHTPPEDLLTEIYTPIE